MKSVIQEGKSHGQIRTENRVMDFAVVSQW